MDLEDEIKMERSRLFLQNVSRIKITPKPTPKATFLTIVSNFTWGH